MSLPNQAVRFLWLSGSIAFFAACSNLPTAEEPQEVKASSEQQFADFQEKADRYEFWIARMDPFVIQVADVSYQLDQESFLASLDQQYRELLTTDSQVAGTSNDDLSVILELMDSVKMSKRDDQLAERGLSCTVYWWGKKCCYWGNEGWAVTALMAAGAAIPPFGYILTPYAAWAAYLMEVHHRMCTNVTWVGGIWLTAS